MNRLKRHKRIRRKIAGTLEKPRVSVYRSSKNVQVQFIDDVNSKTLFGMSTISLKATGKPKSEISKMLGKEIADAAKKLKIENVVFDRGGYKFHGRVKALAESLRENGLKF